MDRRVFIKHAGTMISVPAILGGQTFALWGMPESNPVLPENRILVSIQLDGGNDGLNTIIPIDQYSTLSQLRPEIIIPPEKILPLNDKTGVHPSFFEISELFRDQKIMIIQNVGYPGPNLSHFRSKEIMLSASRSDQVISTGWFGRYLSLIHPEYPGDYPNAACPHPLAITIGNMSSPSCMGDYTDMGIAIQNLTSTFQSQAGSTDYPDTPYGIELKYVAEAMEKTSLYLQEVLNTGNAARNLSTYYPASGNSLSDQLKIVARLISGGLKTPYYQISLGGFDTHSAQVVSDSHETGTHANQLKKVSQAVFAFLDDINLNGKGDNVIGLISTEFGRRIRSNKSDGTDHGEAFPAILFGNSVNPVIFGENPQLDLSMDTKTNVMWKIDFKRIYRSLLTDWFNTTSNEASQILNGNFEHISILKTAVNFEEYAGYASSPVIYPNPVANDAVIRFLAPGGRCLVQIINLSGQVVWRNSSSYTSAGIRSVAFSRNGLPSGIYMLVVENGENSKSCKIMIR